MPYRTDIWRLRPYCTDNFPGTKFVYFCGQEQCAGFTDPSNVFYVNHDWEKEIHNGSVSGFMSIAANLCRNNKLSSFTMYIFDDKFKILRNITREIKIKKIQRSYRKYARIKKIKMILPYLMELKVIPNDLIKIIVLGSIS